MGFSVNSQKIKACHIDMDQHAVSSCLNDYRSRAYCTTNIDKLNDLWYNIPAEGRAQQVREATIFKQDQIAQEPSPVLLVEHKEEYL